MKIIVSPAKRMKESSYDFELSKPIFYEDSLTLISFLKTLSKEELSSSYNIKGKLLEESYSLIADFSKDTIKYPALFTYDGIQFKYMDPKSLNKEELEFLNSNLIILSGLYGVLRPFDGISFYRLEMEAKFPNKEIKSAYSFWANKIFLALYENEDTILNLASLEYSKTLKTYLTKDQKLIDVYFYVRENNKLIEKGVYAKMLRGLMVRYIAKNKITNIEDLKSFNELNYIYNKEESNLTKLVFIKKEN